MKSIFTHEDDLNPHENEIKQVNIKFISKDLQIIDNYCKGKKIKRSEFLRHLIRQYFKNEELIDK